MTTKIEHIWSILCRGTAIDGKSNNISLFNALEQIGVEKEQIEQAKQKAGKKNAQVGVPFEFELVTLWMREGTRTANVPVKLTVIDPRGKKILEQERSIQFEANKARLRSRQRFNGMPITEQGIYRFKISAKDGNTYRHVASIPLEVKFQDANKKRS